MRTRALTAELQVSELGLGTWGLSGDGYGPVSEAVQDEVIERARAYGITLYETADVYGGGAMESRLGRLFASDRNVTVVTKIGTDLSASPARKRFDLEYVKAACERSVERLQCSGRDVVLLHNPAVDTLTRTDACGVLAELVKAGTLTAWGVSAGSYEVARAALDRGAQVLELAYNVLSPSDLENLELTAGRVGVLARSTLAHGLLCGQWPDSKTFSGDDHRAERWTAEQLRGRLRQLSAVSGILGGDVLTLRAAALRFVLENPVVTSAIIGPRSRVQLDQLVREAGQGPPYLATALIQRMREQLGRMGAYR